MRLARVATPDGPRRAVVDGDTVRVEDGSELALAGAPLLAPVQPANVLAVGLNYRDHASEATMAVPERPILFMKHTGSVVGPGETIQWRASVAAQVDYEAELAVVIGRDAFEISEAQALDVVAGYTCLNDVSARDLQFADPQQQWVLGKSLDTFCPIGPWVVTPEEFGDPRDVAVSCVVSGEKLQHASTADMLFPVAELLSYLSRHVRLRAGDVIATGTPPGVGAFRTPPRFLRDGDVVTVAIDGIGELTNPVRVLP